MKAKLYFYSNRNIVGTCTGILAAGLAATGIIHDLWPIIIAGAYGAGALITPTDPRTDVLLASELSNHEIIAGLTRIVVNTKHTLPAPIASDVEEICNLLTIAIPRVAKMQANSSLAFDIRTTATEYLPQTLDRYFQMPKAFRATVRDRSGQTPTQMLSEQITLLKNKLTEITADLASADMDKLAGNGLFLKQKFAVPEFANIID